MAQNIFYYSNYCKHSQKVLQCLVKANLTNEINFLCIDKRGRDPNTNQMFIITEGGERVLLPPNVHSVPAMLLVKEQYRVIYGDEILQNYESRIVNDKMNATNFNGEPMGFSLGGSGMNLGGGGALNSLSASYSGRQSIITPPEEFTSNKIKGDDSIVSSYEQMRKTQDAQLGIGKMPANPFAPSR
jgi:hypothetical protein